MLTKELAAVFNPLLSVLLLSVAFSPLAHSADFHLQELSDRGVRSFKAVDVPLAEFVREYSRISGIPMTLEGPWTNFLKGNVTLFLRKDLSKETYAELFHRVLADNGFAAIDAPAGNGWIIQRQRNARDGALPIYEAKNLPVSSRLVTTSYKLNHVHSEMVARNIRSFMPANSRIIPFSGSLLLITDIASNIHKLTNLIARMDTEEGGKRLRELEVSDFQNQQNQCGEIQIEKLVVKNLELQESNSLGATVKNGGIKK